MPLIYTIQTPPCPSAIVDGPDIEMVVAGVGVGLAVGDTDGVAVAVVVAVLVTVVLVVALGPTGSGCGLLVTHPHTPTIKRATSPTIHIRIAFIFHTSMIQNTSFGL
jgi:hypothetical protein